MQAPQHYSALDRQNGTHIVWYAISCSRGLASGCAQIEQKNQPSGNVVCDDTLVLQVLEVCTAKKSKEKHKRASSLT